MNYNKLLRERVKGDRKKASSGRKTVSNYDIFLKYKEKRFFSFTHLVVF